MTTANPENKGTKISTAVQIIAALLAIASFIFGIANWGDIQQYFWRQQIVGTWQDQAGIVTRFDKDGNFASGGLLPSTGTYLFTENDRVILQMAGLFGVVGNQIYDIDLSGNTMTWKDQAYGTEIIFTKIR